MKTPWPARLLGLWMLFNLSSLKAADELKPGRDPGQAVDEEYTKKIKEYTTEPFFLSPLVDYLPAARNVPTPAAVLGDIAGAPGKMPYAADVYRYLRMLEKAVPGRVRVFSIGTTEEGREMVAAAVSSETNMAKLEENRARLAKLADPRSIKMDDAAAERIIEASVPIYYITGALHSQETGAPTALMELAYRLAVDESAYVKAIRNGVITLITPIVEVDGWDKQTDVYRWHVANPKLNSTPLIYWGKYVLHDNNRDAMGLTLSLTRNVLKTFTGWKAQLLHDLHESVPYLYDDTVGDGPYNAWLDPILTDEWQMLGWNNVSAMTKFGMPGVFAHGSFDTWTPGYLMFIAATHNGISRLYETFGNAGADTVERTLSPQEYARTWYRQNPPLPKSKWSQRNNNNYQQTGLLTGLSYFSTNSKLFLRNFYLKSKNSIEKPKTSGPAAYVFSADDPRPGGQAELLRTLQLQGCEIHRASAPFSVTMPAKKKNRRVGAEAAGAEKKTAPASDDKKEEATVETKKFPAGSYIIRMDQPYSRIADMLLDYQYWSPNDPQKSPFDDTGWTFGELGNLQVLRVVDPKVLETPMELVSGEVRSPGGVEGSGPIFAINHNADIALMTFRYRVKNAEIEVAEEPFESGGRKFNRGSFLIRGISEADLRTAASELGLKAYSVSTPPSVKTHPAKPARIALLHTWQSTQSEGWWRIALEQASIPYTYISTQDVAADKDLNSKYDAILFPPVGRGGAQSIVAGLPMFGNPLPWKKTAETPNLGTPDATNDVRPGLGWQGIENLQSFVKRGGLLVGSMDTAEFAVSYGFSAGVTVNRPQRFRSVGSVLRSKVVDSTSPLMYGYGENLSVMCSEGPIFSVSNMIGGRGGRRRAPEDRERPTGRGTVDDPDTPQNRRVAEEPEEPQAEAWEAPPITEEQKRNPIGIIPPQYRPRVVLRYGDSRDLLVSGLLEGGNEIAQRPAVIDVPFEKGHVVLFSINPLWRGETQGSYFMVFNAILNAGSLDAGRKQDTK
jgi:hypothetical protein